MTKKDLKYEKTNSINCLSLIFCKVNSYFEKINGNKYLTLAPTSESNEIIKKYKKLWRKIRDLIRQIIINSDD